MRVHRGIPCGELLTVGNAKSDFPYSYYLFYPRTRSSHGLTHLLLQLPSRWSPCFPSYLHPHYCSCFTQKPESYFKVLHMASSPTSSPMPSSPACSVHSSVEQEKSFSLFLNFWLSPGTKTDQQEKNKQQFIHTCISYIYMGKMSNSERWLGIQT